MQRPKSPISLNQNGGALVMALIASVVLGIAAMFAQQQATDTEKNLRRVRVRSMISLRENLARSLMNQSRTYNCVPGSGVFPNCTIRVDEAFLKTQVNLEIPSCVPSEEIQNSYSSANDFICGIMIEPNSISYDPSTHSTKMKIIYTGLDVPAKSTGQEVEVKLNYLATAGKVISCPIDHPFLIGISATGQAQCGDISKKLVCKKGEFLVGLNSLFEAFCRNVPLSSRVVCSKDGDGNAQYIMAYHWADTYKFDPECNAFLNPFDYFKMVGKN